MSELTNLVNANLGITNITEKDEIRNTMMKTFIELADKLKAHCGPYSGTAILTNPDDPLAEPVFTKDGINIVRAMQYAAPIQDFVRKQLAYMGARIERSAGDGTTSTMILMAYTMASLLEFISNSKNIYSTNDIRVTWQMLVDRVEAKYEEFAKRAKLLTDKKDIEFVAASQAYTSSHGDIELAKCIGELFANSPRVVWDTLYVNKAIYESEERYKVTVNKSQYTLDNVRLFPTDKCNAELGTELKLDNAKVLIQDTIAVGDDYQKALIAYIDACIESEEQLLVVCSDRLDQTTRQYFEEKFIDYPRHNTIFVLVPQEDAMLNDVTALLTLRYESNKNIVRKDANNEYKNLRASMQGENPTFELPRSKVIETIEPCLDLFRANITFSGNTFRFLSGLFEDDDTGINPFYQKDDHKDYNDFVKQVKIIIDKERADVSRSNTRVIKSFIRILHKLLATKDVVFTVGGAAYDNAAAQDVAMDALLATKCSLTKGFVAGRCVTLKRVLNELQNEKIDDHDGYVPIKKDELYHAFIFALLSGIEEIDKALEDSIGITDSIKKALEYKDAPVDFTRLDDPSYEIPSSLDNAIQLKKDYCILEPVQTDLTFIKRFGEIGLKFLTANRVITAGYLFDSKK